MFRTILAHWCRNLHARLDEGNQKSRVKAVDKPQMDTTHQQQLLQFQALRAIAFEIAFPACQRHPKSLGHIRTDFLFASLCNVRLLLLRNFCTCKPCANPLCSKCAACRCLVGVRHVSSRGRVLAQRIPSLCHSLPAS